MLLSVSGGVERPGVYEVPIGIPLETVLQNAGAMPASGYLIGGYFGTWLPPAATRHATMSRQGLTPLGASLGCGVVSVMPTDVCTVEEVAGVVRWMAGQSAGQCGPCVKGVGAIARAWTELAAGRDTRPQIDRWCAMIRGRGACRLPDGVAGFVTSAVEVFAEHLAEHATGRCTADRSRRVLGVPAAGGR